MAQEQKPLGFVRLLRERLSDFRVKEILHRVDSLIYTPPKNSTDNHLWSHFRAIMALDHGRLGVESKFLENKSGRIFSFDKFTLENLANKSGWLLAKPFQKIPKSPTKFA